MADLDDFDEGMRRIAVSQAQMKVHEARVWRNIAEVKAMLAAAGYPVRESEPPAPAAPPARPVRRAAHAVTPASGNWSVMTGDPSVHVEVDGSFVV
ncbi:MAG: hypothetical protein JO306_00835 [Gemmatimonadetes bacterium]|nr:hypothetical protein [Gemmatimonadota bacterium]